MLKLIVELIGTFIFLAVILRIGQPIPIAITLAAAIFFGSAISGGHFNPAVSFMTYLNNGMSATDLVQYVIVQMIAAAMALYFHKTSLGVAPI